MGLLSITERHFTHYWRKQEFVSFPWTAPHPCSLVLCSLYHILYETSFHCPAYSRSGAIESFIHTRLGNRLGRLMVSHWSRWESWSIIHMAGLDCARRLYVVNQSVRWRLFCVCCRLPAGNTHLDYVCVLLMYSVKRYESWNLRFPSRCLSGGVLLSPVLAVIQME